MNKFIAALSLSGLILGCSTEEDPSGDLSASEKSVIGTWAGSVAISIEDDFDEDGEIDEITGTMTITVVIGQEKTYSEIVKTNFPTLSISGEVSKEVGTWKVENGSFKSTPTNCQESDEPGGTMKLIACEQGDSQAINITGDTWNVNEEVDGEIHTLQMKKI